MMRCIDSQNLLSDYIDGALELGEQSKLEAHLANCEACRAVRDDLLQIVHFSNQLPQHSPSAALWSRIQQDIDVERPPAYWVKVKAWWNRLSSSRVRLSLAQMTAAAAAIVIVISASFLVFRERAETPKLGPSSRISPDEMVRLSNGDLKQIEDRISQLSETIEQRKQSWDPELRESFEKNLYYVDQSLVECRHQLKDNPTDDIAQELMLNAYREKVRLLQGYERF
jgi:anti-sigma-K factor RskA